MQKRNNSADLLKCLAIYGVVFIHGASLLGGNSKYLEWINWIFRCCVPVFIIVWAYFFELSLLKGESVLKNSLTRLKHLILVFILWSLVYYFLTADWSHISFRSAVTKYWSGYGWSGQYFFVILFQLIIVFFLLRRIYDHKFILLSSVIICSAITVFYGYWYPYLSPFIKSLGERPFIFWINYVFIGIHLARHPDFYLHWAWSLALLCIPAEFFILEQLKQDHLDYITPAVLTGSSLFAMVILNYPLSFKKATTLSGFIKFISKNTMTIFLLNPLVIIILKPVTAHIPMDHFYNIYRIAGGIISTIVIFSFCLLVAFSINKTRLKGIIN